MAARRTAIMSVARDMLAEKNVGDISLRELSDRVGLAKSNVLRYFDSREAIFLEVLDEEFTAWLSEIDTGLGRPRARKPGYANEIRVATVIANTLVERPLLCELVGSMAGELERNISYEFARDFKARAMGKIDALGSIGGPAPAVAAAGVHCVLRRGRAHLDRRHVSVLGAHRTCSGGDSRDRLSGSG